jgi:hypothetical protein
VKDNQSLGTKFRVEIMLTKILDQVYNVYCIALLAGIVCLDVMHFPLWPKSWIFSFSPRLEQYHIRTFNDPLSANLPVPNGWQSGMYFFEQLYIPFLFYQLFAKSAPRLRGKVDRRRAEEGVGGDCRGDGVDCCV